MIIVSSCLAGIECRYDGNCNKDYHVINMVKQGKALPLCPEQLGGLTTPRTPCEIVIKNGEKRIVTKDGNDLTKEFHLGSEMVLKIAKTLGIKKAILKSKSPSCGYGKVFDGSFSGNLVDGNGITSDLLIKNGIEVEPR